ncbi:MAG: hypothetical protein QW051_00905 [Candidatus Aenigmatarchaeota archaeon]
MKKGLMPIWASALLGFIFFILGLYLAVSFFGIPIVFWLGVILVVLGLIMMFVAAVLT